MKTCPLCGETYSERIDFCFDDGAVLKLMPSALDAPVPRSPNASGAVSPLRAPPKPRSTTPPPAPAGDRVSDPGAEPAASPPSEPVGEPPVRPRRAAAPPEPAAPPAEPSPPDRGAAVGAEANESAETSDLDDPFFDDPSGWPGDLDGAPPEPDDPSRRRGALWPIASVLFFLLLLVGGWWAASTDPSMAPQVPGDAQLVDAPVDPIPPPEPPSAPSPDRAPGDEAAGEPDSDPPVDEAPEVDDPSESAEASPIATDPRPADPGPPPGASAPTPPPRAATASRSPAPRPQATTATPDPAPKPAPSSAPPPSSSASPWDAPVTAAVGEASFTSDPPGATVRIDGTVRGVTPLKLSLDHGTYNLEWTLDGYKAQRRQITVASGQPKFPATLQPIRSTSADVEPVLLVAAGWEGATLYIDGQAAGRVPVQVPLEPGVHTFILRIGDRVKSVRTEYSPKPGATSFSLVD